ncbi:MULTISPECIES: ABC transporter permease [unclassified Streptomyces]|uniref:ABC transporter permease n=1 Tax=unclassified Streptomyces TaxID=2593676 RepID=UPI00081DC913|nr:MULTISPECIES: ABC transporter permease [unclassified Streptomyces]MYZ36446.1 ABC transporter permease [Streptomyces sp. SID4917]SCF83618.1 monosaccharide ABC transporter membrane protein, CUT2 family [Streptomyces sp. MnatMP-M17]
MTILGAAPPTADEGTPPRRRVALTQKLALERFSGVYIIIVMIVGFSLWLPDTFGTADNARSLIAGQAIAGVIALAATISLISGVFDLSVAATMSLSISVAGQLQAKFGLNPWLVVVICLAVGAVIGIINAFVVTVLNIDPVIGTLAMASVLSAVTYWVASGQSILYGINPGFAALGRSQPLGVPIALLFLIAITALVWYVLEQTPAGRYLYAAGANPRAALLSGVRVTRLTWSALISSGVLAAAAGILLTMQVGTAPFQGGLPYLLPAYSAAFLGSTQIKPGRFNAMGTLVAIYVVAVAVKGLQLRYPDAPWISDLVQGLICLIAVGFAVWAARRRSARP